MKRLSWRHVWSGIAGLNAGSTASQTASTVSPTVLPGSQVASLTGGKTAAPAPTREFCADCGERLDPDAEGACGECGWIPSHYDGDELPDVPARRTL